jgi:hypothetical protein
MRRLVSIAALFLSFGLGFASLAMAQSEIYVPALAEIMSTAQWRHIKLWFAGKHANWELASYELRQVRASLEDAATHYHGIPIEYVGATVGPILTTSAAIEAKDSVRFIKGYNALTAACNACHEGVGRGFIVIQVPTASPFSDQSFAPPKPPQP